MVRYFYALTPLVIVGTVVLLSLPWLGLVALMILALVALGAVGALAWAIVAAPYLLIRSIGRRWHGRSVAAHQPSAALSLADGERAWLEMVERGGTL
jgi:hypothetical protein